ncbi:acyl-CoA dehydrogenase family protein [Haloechinothrix halophila]|uniref:acyl-CoA dehydrogenase family protein n=1 Tax=Haloechinothrix halophila TaxID=1069073 RepID=UPI000557162B|nr:acyl-CoA dehydrogenase family protein [Haloechinothrix halophila]
MPIAITDTQRALADSIRDWAERAGSVAAARDGAPERTWAGLADIGLFGIAVPDELGGAGASIADAAAGLEAAAEALVPGPVLSTMLAAVLLGRHADAAVAKEVVPGLVAGTSRAAVALEPGTVTGTATPDGVRLSGDAGLLPGADTDAVLLLSADVDGEQRWCVVSPGLARVERLESLDLSRDVARVHLDDVVLPPTALLPGTQDVREVAATFAAAEASGVAAWCLRTASEYAGVREQFGVKIGTFQAVKQLCATALCRAEQAAALAWDAARAADDDPDQQAFAAAVAAAGALDAAVDNAKDCIQTLGGIGFTWEHDAHLYLRRAVALRQWLGGSAAWRRRAARLALDGTRRELAIDLREHGPDAAEAERVRADIAEIAAAPAEHRRGMLAETGYLMPHWPKPYGLDASPALQLAIDAELDRAGIERPDLVIGGWATATILRHGTDDQRDRFLLPTLRGELSWCQLFSEPEAGSDLASLRTVAERTDGGWLLTGQKVWTSLAREADWAICLARTDKDVPKHKGITYFLVDMTSPGIETRPLAEITGEERFNEVFLTSVFVPDANVVGDQGDGWRLARTTLANERVAMSDSSLGESLERLLKLVPEDADLAEIGRLLVDGAACAVLDLRSVLNQLAAQGQGAESSVRKLIGVRHRQDVAEVALDLLGPAGVADAAATHDVQHEFLLSRCLSIAGGTTEVLRNVAAERILGLPRG